MRTLCEEHMYTQAFLTSVAKGKNREHSGSFYAGGRVQNTHRVPSITDHNVRFTGSQTMFFQSEVPPDASLTTCLGMVDDVCTCASSLQSDRVILVPPPSFVAISTKRQDVQVISGTESYMSAALVRGSGSLTPRAVKVLTWSHRSRCPMGRARDLGCRLHRCRLSSIASTVL
jgi:hypothetical protein